MRNHGDNDNGFKVTFFLNICIFLVQCMQWIYSFYFFIIFHVSQLKTIYLHFHLLRKNQVGKLHSFLWAYLAHFINFCMLKSEKFNFTWVLLKEVRINLIVMSARLFYGHSHITHSTPNSINCIPIYGIFKNLILLILFYGEVRICGQIVIEIFSLSHVIWK